MVRVSCMNVPLAVIEGGENMAEFQLNRLLTSLGCRSTSNVHMMRVLADAIVDAFAEMKRTGVLRKTPRRGLLETCTRGSRAP